MPQVPAFIAGAFKAGAAATVWQSATVLAVKTAATLGLSYVAQKLTASRYDTTASLQGRTQNIRSTAQPRVTIYGQVRYGGQLVFAGHSGEDNEYLWLVLVHASHECEGIDAVFVNGEEVPLAGAQPVVGNRYREYLRVWKHLGSDDQLADPNLMAAFPGVWTASHRGRGCCYTVWRLLWDNEVNVWPNGIPVLTARLRGKRVYDWRDASTRYTANWALCVADYIKDNRDADNGDFAVSELGAAATLSDELVGVTGGGTEPRYEINAVIRADEDPEEVIDKMRAAAMGWISESGGFWTIHAGGWRAPSIELDENDFHGPINVTTKQSFGEGGNAVRGVFADVEENFVPVEFPAVENAFYLAEDGDRRRWIDLNLEYTISGAMAQRLAKIALEEARQQITVSARLTNRGLLLRGGDVVMVSLVKFGWTQKAFEVQGLELVEEQGDGGPVQFVEIGLRETASGVYDWNNGEETTRDLAPNTVLRNAWEVPNPAWVALETGADTVEFAPSGMPSLRIMAQWSFAGDATVQRFEVEYRVPAGHELSFLGWLPLAEMPANARRVWLVENVYEGVDYEFRIRAVNTLGVFSEWVESANITAVGDIVAPGVPSGLSEATGAGGERILEWTNPSDDDLRGVEIWRRIGSNTFDESACVKIAEARADEYTVARPEATLPAGIKYYFARSVDTSGNTSAAVAFFDDSPV